ncbi:MAG TPA: YdeI/OmpD-associated family protein [Terriglobales bacterium]|nr:YdeI/OmpD-associated family protein [Terriglobales bacterium]
MEKKFRGKLQEMGPGGHWTALRVPFNVEKVWGSRARVSVRGNINGFAFRNSVFPDGKGVHYMMVNKALQAGAGAKPGESVAVAMAPDTAPRKVAVPAVLKRALARNVRARENFAALAWSHRKAYVDFIQGAKQAETRERRAAKSVAMIAAGKKIM